MTKKVRRFPHLSLFPSFPLTQAKVRDDECEAPNEQVMRSLKEHHYCKQMVLSSLLQCSQNPPIAHPIRDNDLQKVVGDCGFSSLSD